MERRGDHFVDDEDRNPPRDEHQREDERLDEELEESFPASDPVPWRHGDRTPPTAAADHRFDY